eukprot:151075_1
MLIIQIPSTMSKSYTQFVASYMNGSSFFLYGNTSDFIHSTNDKARLIMQSDGNLVFYTKPDDWSDDHWTVQINAQWATHGNLDNSFLAIQSDGNLVVYSSPWDVAWASNTVVNGYQSEFRLFVNDGGYAFLMDVDDSIMWSIPNQIDSFIPEALTIIFTLGEYISSSNLKLTLWFNNTINICSFYLLRAGTGDMFGCGSGQDSEFVSQSCNFDPSPHAMLLIEVDTHVYYTLILQKIIMTTSSGIAYGIQNVCIDNTAKIGARYANFKLSDNVCISDKSHYSVICADNDECYPPKQIVYFDTSQPFVNLLNAEWSDDVAVPQNCSTLIFSRTCEVSHVSANKCNHNAFNSLYCCYYLDGYSSFLDDTEYDIINIDPYADRSDLQQQDMLMTITLVKDIGFSMFVIDTVLLFTATAVFMCLWRNNKKLLRYVMVLSVFGTVIDIGLTFASIGVIVQNDLIVEIGNLYDHRCYSTDAAADIIGLKEQLGQVLILDSLEAALDVVGLCILSFGSVLEQKTIKTCSESIHGGLFGLDW